MVTSVWGKNNRPQRPGDPRPGGASVEFANLLDPIEAGSLSVDDSESEPIVHHGLPHHEPARIEADVDEAVADPPPAEHVAATTEPEHVDGPMPASRFASDGMDDDRLPVRAKRRWLRR
jgi:hypothetical protein